MNYKVLFVSIFSLAMQGVQPVAGCKPPVAPDGLSVSPVGCGSHTACLDTLCISENQRENSSDAYCSLTWQEGNEEDLLKIINVMKEKETFNEDQRGFMRMAIELSRESVEKGGGPFGAVIVRDGEVIATGSNSVTLKNDPTAHAEVSAIRAACEKLGDFKLDGCEIYSSCEPCPMCLSAVYWAGIERLYYANTRQDAADIGFDDSFIYDQIPLAPHERAIPTLPMEVMRPESIRVFRMWDDKPDKVEY